MRQDGELWRRNYCHIFDGASCRESNSGRHQHQEGYLELRPEINSTNGRVANKFFKLWLLSIADGNTFASRSTRRRTVLRQQLPLYMPELHKHVADRAE